LVELRRDEERYVQLVEVRRVVLVLRRRADQARTRPARGHHQPVEGDQAGAPMDVTVFVTVTARNRPGTALAPSDVQTKTPWRNLRFPRGSYRSRAHVRPALCQLSYSSSDCARTCPATRP